MYDNKMACRLSLSKIINRISLSKKFIQKKKNVDLSCAPDAWQPDKAVGAPLCRYLPSIAKFHNLSGFVSWQIMPLAFRILRLNPFHTIFLLLCSTAEKNCFFF